jgi:Zn-dependent protease
MLLRYLELVTEAPLAFLMLISAFVFSMLVGLSFHEFSHALAADRLGDNTPRRFGRLTLNPRAHLDPVGSLMILFVGFGWAKPTPVNPNNTKSPQRSMALIALAGPLSNLVIAGVASVPIKLELVPFFHPFVGVGNAALAGAIWGESATTLLGLFLGTVVVLNVLLAVFNFLPLAPLDGFKVALGVLPRDLSLRLARLEAWGPGILLLLFMLPFFTQGQYDPLFSVMGPPVNFLLDVFLGGEGI